MNPTAQYVDYLLKCPVPKNHHGTPLTHRAARAHPNRCRKGLQPWTEQDFADLAKYYKLNWSNAKIGLEMVRTENAIKAQIHLRGLKGRPRQRQYRIDFATMRQVQK